jgi:23S rRNA pseudouridine955/2504/2580 synthase
MTVTQENNGQRLDRFLRQELENFPAGAMFRLLRKGKIRVNGAPVKDPKHILKTDDHVEVDGFSEDRQGPRSTAPAQVDIPVLFEDECLLVVDKPRGVSVHSGAGETQRTVIGILTAKAKDYTPFLVHRLDKYTSGVLVLAKDREIAGRLGELFRKAGEREVNKRYLAVVFGKAPKAGRIALPLDNQEAFTRYKMLQELPWQTACLSLLDVEISTGRKHQIRRHLAGVNLPVAGDDEYGNWELNKLFYGDYKIREYILHSQELSFRHPVSEEKMSFRAPIPREIYGLFKNVGKKG